MPKIEEAPYVKFREFIRKAEAIYANVKEALEKNHWGEIMVIEPDSGDYFVDKNRRKAMQNAEAKYPDRLFHMRRIGDNPAVTRFPARVRPAGLRETHGLWRKPIMGADDVSRNWAKWTKRNPLTATY